MEPEVEADSGKSPKSALSSSPKSDSLIETMLRMSASSSSTACAPPALSLLARAAPGPPDGRCLDSRRATPAASAAAVADCDEDLSLRCELVESPLARGGGSVARCARSTGLIILVGESKDGAIPEAGAELLLKPCRMSSGERGVVAERALVGAPPRAEDAVAVARVTSMRNLAPSPRQLSSALPDVPAIPSPTAEPLALRPTAVRLESVDEAEACLLVDGLGVVPPEREGPREAELGSGDRGGEASLSALVCHLRSFGLRESSALCCCCAAASTAAAPGLVMATDATDDGVGGGADEP